MGSRRRTLERILGFAEAQVASLLESGDGLIDAGYGQLVRENVEVADCVVDELEGVSCDESSRLKLRIPSLDPRREASLLYKEVCKL